MSTPKTYRTPAGFKVALEDRLRKRASLRGIVVNRMRQRFVMERFLARIARTFGSTVTLKGGLALERRDTVRAARRAEGSVRRFARRARPGLPRHHPRHLPAAMLRVPVVLQAP